jgi:hypothetical protein
VRPIECEIIETPLQAASTPTREKLETKPSAVPTASDWWQLVELCCGGSSQTERAVEDRYGARGEAGFLHESGTTDISKSERSRALVVPDGPLLLADSI